MAESCSMPEPRPQYEPEDLIEAWLAMTEAHGGAQNVERFARYAPDLGWRSILAVLEHPDARGHVRTLSGSLSIFISQFGADFVDRIEEEAAISSAFRECLADVHPTPVFPIPEALWARLSAAAGVTIGPMKPKMAALYAEFPDMGQLMVWDPYPLAAEDVHGDAIIERVEECAAADQRFRYCLSNVWPVLPEPIWERVVRARGDEPQRG